MAVYRAYRIDGDHRILNAEWLEAPDDAAAVEQAEALCEIGVPIIEVWQFTRLVEALDCTEGGACPCRI